jgi:dipicolinate synthase subunit A
MIKGKTFAVVGGDLRNAHLANLLAEKTSDDKVYGLFLDRDVKLSYRIHKTNDVKIAVPQSDIVVFPVPMLNTKGKINTPLSNDELDFNTCFDYIQPETLVLAGQVPENVCDTALKNNIKIIDYLKREEFAIMNAVPTAEGAIEIALRELPITLHGATCLITGYGRISKALSKLLLAFGADVRVVARKHSDLAWIEINGAQPVHISDIDRHLKDADVLFNTVPAMILGEEKLSKLGRSCLVVDLASKPGGVDFLTAKTLGLKTIWALSLPLNVIGWHMAKPAF